MDGLTRIPSRITPCPIVETTAEFRFKSLIPSDAFAGLVYSALPENFRHMEATPISKMPPLPMIGGAFLELAHQPHFKFSSDLATIGVGPNAFSVTPKGAYPGWGKLKPMVLDIAAAILKSGIINKWTRFGLRYINRFELDVISRLTISVQFRNQPFRGEKSVFKSVIVEEPYSMLLQLATDAHFVARKPGVAIDIDTSLAPTNDTEVSVDVIEQFLEGAHSLEKKLFFELLSDQFIETLSPEYNEN